jgi:hypothetical protein
MRVEKSSKEWIEETIRSKSAKSPTSVQQKFLGR